MAKMSSTSLPLKKISGLLAILVAISACIAFVYNLDDRWAKAEDLHRVELRLDQKILTDRLYDLRQRMWMLEDRYGSVTKMPIEVKREYRELQQEYNLTQRKLSVLPRYIKR